MPLVSKQRNGGHTIHEIDVPFPAWLPTTEPDVPEPVPCAAPVGLPGPGPALQFGQRLTEDLERRWPDQRVAIGANLDP